MKIGLLVIGNELLEGKIKDANTQNFALFLSSRNLELPYSLLIGDSETSIQDGLKFLFERCDVILTSGGLGPTLDDITKASIGKFLNKKIKFSEEAYKISFENYQKFNRPFEDKNHGYCFLPENFIPLNNSTGFAPCFAFIENNKVLLCAPGVPREFESFLSDHFDNLTQNHRKNDLYFGSVNFKTRKVPEEKIFSETDPSLWEKLSQFGTVSSLPNLMGVDIGIRVQGKNQLEVDQKKDEIHKIINESPVKKIIWQTGTLSLEEWVVKLACEKNISYGFAESATGGLCSQRVTSVQGSSHTFIGSTICYSEKIKENELNVARATIDQYGVVSEEVAKEMCEGLAKKFGTKIAISITGYAGPGGGSETHPVGTACFGVHSRGQTKTYTFQYHGDRNLRRMRFSQECLYLLLAELESFA